MATITFSDEVRRLLATDIFKNIDGMKLMQGTVPTDFTSLTSANSLSSDVLVNFSSLAKGAEGNGYRLGTSTHYTAAQSGTATWLWGYELDTDNTTILNQFVATVGTTGTDVVIGNTAIIAGANYRLQDIIFEFPEDYTY